MNVDHAKYYRFTDRQRFNTAVNSLLGIVEGISIDSKINDDEIGFLASWLEEYRQYRNRHPFDELIPVVAEALADRVLTEDERSDILWLCERLRSTDYYDATTADIQRLHAIMGGIVSDGIITEDEIKRLSEWLDEHGHLRRCWPYDEIDSLVMSVLSDKKIDEKEQGLLQAFFSEFVTVGDKRTIARPLIAEDATLQGLCAVCPEITFQNMLFCFTGASNKYTRNEFAELIERLGGTFTKSITPTLDYLVIGAAGNPCWTYACYGRKVEKAVALRKEGYKILLVHEHDFHDSVADVDAG